jgi:crotonobetainyl-CoA:carnitine CoA-transferase CaiB-like acyl-CoA transferase
MNDIDLPLDGMVVVDVSRMLPGGVLARQLLDLGARLIKIEEPGTGDPMRMVPPIVDGIGIGFQTLLRGAESVCLDLTTDEGQRRLRRLASRADILVESFRPGTMAGWGLGYEALAEVNPQLVWCSLSSFGRGEPVRHRLAHDLNLIALTGWFLFEKSHFRLPAASSPGFGLELDIHPTVVSVREENYGVFECRT